MQCNFTTHHKEEHPYDPYKCEHCDKMLAMPNGLFKHQRSQNYLKHGCDICGKRFQFPKQKKIHERTHTKTGLYRCLHCDCHFTLNSTMPFHAATHNTSIQCELCPRTSDKRYNSTYALALHTQGMHSPSWTSFSGINYKWKSAYTHHIKKCGTCKAVKQQERKQRYLFDT